MSQILKLLRLIVSKMKDAQKLGAPGNSKNEGKCNTLGTSRCGVTNTLYYNSFARKNSGLQETWPQENLMASESCRVVQPEYHRIVPSRKFTEDMDKW